MKQVYYLSTCSTCKRILKERTDYLQDFEKREIKSTGLSADELEFMKTLSGSFASLFSRKSQQFKVLGLKDKTLKETDYRDFILSHYSFLKRPVFIIDQQIFIGSEKGVIEALDSALRKA